MPDFEKGNESRGAKIFKTKCSTCHTIDEGGQNKQGPNVFNIIGRKAGQVDNFNYTKANQNSGITWTNETLFDYLTILGHQAGDVPFHQSSYDDSLHFFVVTGMQCLQSIHAIA